MFLAETVPYKLMLDNSSSTENYDQKRVFLIKNNMKISTFNKNPTQSSRKFINNKIHENVVFCFFIDPSTPETSFRDETVNTPRANVDSLGLSSLIYVVDSR